MKLSIFPFENDLDFNKSFVNVLEIENANLFYNIVTSLIMLSNKEQGIEKIFLFDDSGNHIDISKNCYVINDFFNIDVNDKKIITKLYDKVINDLKNDDELMYKIGIEYQNFFNNFIEIFNNYDFELEYSVDFSLKNFFKMIGLGFTFDKSEFLNTFYTFIDIVSEFDLFNVVILTNIRAYFSDEKLIEVYKYCTYKKVKLLLIEPFLNRSVLEYEKRLVIDKNFDDFFVN